MDYVLTIYQENCLLKGNTEIENCTGTNNTKKNVEFVQVASAISATESIGACNELRDYLFRTFF